MIPRKARSLALFIALAAAATAPFFACSAPEETVDEDGASEDAVTGAGNPLGLRLTYDADTKRVNATLKEELKSGEQLRIRVRRGKATLTSQKELKCDDLPRAKAQASRDLANVGKVVYRTDQTIDSNMLSLLKVYDDHRWQSDPTWAAARTREINEAGGPKVLVEACITNGD
jgi:ribosomal protein L4